MKWFIKDNKLFIDDIYLEFEFNIDKAIELDNIIVIVLDVTAKGTMSENVFGVSLSEQKVIWQVERISLIASDPFNRYTDITKGIDGNLYIYNWSGVSVKIDFRTGKVLDQKFVK